MTIRSSAGDQPPLPAGARSSPAVAALLVSVFCARAAMAGQVTVLGKQVYDMTGRELDLGWLGLAEFAPAALLVLVTGAVADRRERRLVGAWASAGQAGVAVLLALYAGTRPTSVIPIFALVFVLGVGRAFAAPAIRALPADIVAADRLPSLVARFSVAWQAAVVVGPVLAGFLYTLDVRLPHLAAAGLLGLSAAALVLVRRPTAPPTVAAQPLATTGLDVLAGASEPMSRHLEAAPPAKATLGDAIAGIRLIRAEPILLGAISLDLFAVLFGGAVALLPAIATDRLGVDAAGLGWLFAAGGLGAGAATLVLALRPLRRRVGVSLLAVVGVFGIATVVLGLTRSFMVAFIAMAVLSAADAVSVFVRSTLVPLVTPEEVRGRVLAVENLFIGASNELGMFESGVTGQLLGPSLAVVLGGVATVVVAGAWWFLFPDLRRVDRFPRPKPGA